YKINVITGAKVIEFNNDGIVYQKDGQEIACKAETIIRAFGMKPNRKLAEEIRSAYPTKTRIVGDSEKIGKVANAIRDGFYAAMSL
ncbi:MAG: NADH:flavin oxidoreductase, partial [Clostridia bacterium]